MKTTGIWISSCFVPDSGWWYLGQFSFIATLVTLVVSARLKKFDRTLEEAALNLGANRFEVIWHITLKFLRPAIIGRCGRGLSDVL